MCHGQLLSQDILRARKSHWCAACARPIEPGRKYVRTTAVVDGDFQSSKLCIRCQALLEVHTENQDDDYCFSLNELHSLVRETGQGQKGWWRTMRSALRERLQGKMGSAWHT